MKIKDWEMKTFNFEIRDGTGIHARPAGLLVKESKKYESRNIIKKWQGCEADGCHGTWRKMR